MVALGGRVPYMNGTIEEVLNKAFGASQAYAHGAIAQIYCITVGPDQRGRRRLSLHCVVSVGHQQGFACTPLPRSLAAAAGERMRLDSSISSKTNRSRSRATGGGAA